MAEATLVETRYSSFDEIEARCHMLLQAVERMLCSGNPAVFNREFQETLRWVEQRE